jgi:hypothetical protein
MSRLFNRNCLLRKRPRGCFTPRVRLSGFLITVFSITSVCSSASAFSGSDSDPVAADPAAENAAPAVPAPAEVVVEKSPYVAITAWQRLGWFDEKTFGISNLAGSVPGAAWMTLLDRPREAGPHWEGFAERYGVGVSTNAVGNAMEAGLGAIWGEDPRYVRAGARAPFKSRIGHIVKWTVLAPNRDGELRPAYARLLAFSGSSFVSNAWREPSDTTVGHSLVRIPLGFLGRMGSNAFDEFWPDTERRVFHRGPSE